MNGTFVRAYTAIIFFVGTLLGFSPAFADGSHAQGMVLRHFTQALVEATLKEIAKPKYQEEFKRKVNQAKARALVTKPDIREEDSNTKTRRKDFYSVPFGFELQASLPEGLTLVTSIGAGPISLELGGGTTFDYTLAAKASVIVDFCYEWELSPCLVAMKFTHLRFLEGTEQEANEIIHEMYGNNIRISVKGRWINMTSLQWGVRYLDPDRGFFATFRAGVVVQVDESGGGNDRRGSLELTRWEGPSGDLGIGWRWDLSEFIQ
ncbi:MAG: hypothetical protein AB1540_13595 [Bdellovibrionota bacterium]